MDPNEGDEKVDGDQKTNEEENIENKENLAMSEDDFSLDEEDEQDIMRTYKKIEKAHIKKINMPLVLTLLYVALNLDKSHIQLTHLIRFITEGRLSLMHWQKFVPKELYPKKLYYCLLFNRNCIKYSYHTTLTLAMQMFKELDLGNPIVPDLRPLLDEYMRELCLPNDMKPLVLSLMHYRSFDYLDINVKFYEAGRIPSYELYVISHILCAIKICFGIDGEYENKLSDAVDKFNEIEDHPKSYNSEPTERLFSFREWCNYIQFRKSMLWSQSLYLGAPNYSDMNDYVAFEHLSEKPDFKKTLKDEIARDIINKLPNVEVNVIPKSEFPVTTTPHTTYTRVIVDHQQDPTIKQLLSEDFTQYSLKYITEDMFLVDPDSINPKNIISGVNRQQMTEFGNVFQVYENCARSKFIKKMVYVRDCDNHNWMVTQRPKLEHIAKTSKEINGEIDENGNASDEFKFDENSVITDESINDRSTLTSINGNDEKTYELDSKVTSVIAEDSKEQNDLNSIFEMEINKKEQDDEDLKIPEENECDNIFDDNFDYLDTKKEKDEDPEYNEIDEPMPEIPTDNNIFDIPDIFRHDGLNQEYRKEKDSDESSEDSIHLNPESLDRAKAIKELVIHACNKYKISLPGKYIYQPRKNYIRRKKYGNVERASVLGLTTQKIKGLVAEYHNQIEQDVFIQMSNLVQSVISDFNETKEEEAPMEVDEPPIDENDNTAGVDNGNENEINKMQTLNNTTQDPNIDETADDGNYKLFDEESDGETQAEELLPKKNPEYDETTHEISQLFMKPNKDARAPEISLNPNLYKIIDEKIEGKKEENLLPPEDKENSDSEEEMSLSMLQDLKLLREQLTKQAQSTKAKRLKPLIKNSIPPYNYWVRHYAGVIQYAGFQQRFATELDNTFPAAFKILLKECADVVGYPPYYLYKSLQRVESCIKDKYVRKKRFYPSYFEKEKNRFRTSRDML